MLARDLVRAGRSTRIVLRAIPIGCALALGAVASPVAAAALASAPIDLSLFRDGEVSHSVSSHGPWTVSCDAVMRLRLKYCSLRTAVSDAAGVVVANLTLSTGDDGRPAALVVVPLGVRVSTGITIVAEPNPSASLNTQRSREALPANQTLQVAECDRQSCLAVWTLRQTELAILNRGGKLKLTYQRYTSSLPSAGIDYSKAVQNIEAYVPTSTFSEAVSSSLR